MNGISQTPLISNVRRRMPRSLKFIMVSAVVATAISIFGFSTIMWDGGFPQAQFRVKIVDSSGVPLLAITMRVYAEDGTSASRYPVVEFDGTDALESDAEGVFTFHQIRSGLQFGGSCNRFFGISIGGDCSSPEFDCRFYIEDKLVHSEPFSSLLNHTLLKSARTARSEFLLQDILPPEMLDEYPSEELNSVAVDTDFPIVERTITLTGA